MVDVSAKRETRRRAVASARVRIGARAFQLVKQNGLSKGDVLTVSEIAGVMGVKRTSDLIPLCHSLSGVDLARVEASLDENDGESVLLKCEVSVQGRTGVEMEALTGVSTAALTVYDMCKAVNKEIVIEGIRLEMKTGGESGDFFRAEK